ncbi:facilitated trehalose transporter tret1-1-like protein [Holotrichia oblita]|uniref:Facilitated trehalose transporter tret1-1-like protein n=1 Tax=Holotrichia oblita TaxID=644536 RepID=A0ACB9SLD0_HOLOL|nr:facilitated trehalose transporter tret1-1-like protein [Holotrichia oblita]
MYVSPVLFLIFGTILIPESPYFLVKKAKYEEARASLSAFQPIDIEHRFIQIKTSTGVSLSLTIIQQLTAFGAILLYMHHIFDDANLSLSKEIATILMGVVQVVACLSSHIFFEKFERKPLELISSIATCLSLFILSIYFYLVITTDTTSIAWLPIASLIVYIFFCSVGMGPIPTTLLGDTFPLNLKQLISSITTTCCFIFSFIVAKIFPILIDLVDNWFAFLIFGVLNGISIIFIWFNMPEITNDNAGNEVFEME